MYKRCPVKTNSLDMTPVRSQTSLNFLKKKGCEFCNEFQIDLLSYVLSRIERIIKQTNTVSYSVALNFCGSKICDFYVVFHYPLKTVPAKKKIPRKYSTQKFSPLAKLYLQKSDEESCCCLSFNTSLSFRNKTMECYC